MIAHISRKPLVLSFFLALALSCAAWAGDTAPADVFRQANEAYRQGRWEAAAEGYRALVDQGVDDATVWYNLGNAYAQMDDLGRSRACYERALRRNPRDADARANLAVLEKRLVDKAPDNDLLASLAHAFTLNELAVATSGLWFVTAGLAAVWLRRRREWLGWVAGLSLALLLGCGGLYATAAMHPPMAVVIPGEVTLFNGPGRDYTASISLHAGARVDVLRAEGDWREVAALNHVKGWVRAEQLETL